MAKTKIKQKIVNYYKQFNNAGFGVQQAFDNFAAHPFSIDRAYAPAAEVRYNWGQVTPLVQGQNNHLAYPQQLPRYQTIPQDPASVEMSPQSSAANGGRIFLPPQAQVDRYDPDQRLYNYINSSLINRASVSSPNYFAR